MSESKRKSNLSKTSSSGEESSDSDADMSDEEIQVDFEGRAPVDPDSDGIRQLLQQVFLKAHVNCMQVANLIISQNFVGSVIDQCESMDECSDTEGDDMYECGTIFGITTVLNLTVKKAEPCIKEIHSYIMEKLRNYTPVGAQEHFQQVLNDDKISVGYLINERFINIPAQISVPLLKSLNSEVIAAKDKGMPFDFDYYVMIIKICRKESKNGTPVQVHYMNSEEEVIAKKSLSSFEYSVADEADATLMFGRWLDEEEILTPYRKILLLDATALPQIIDDIEIFIKKNATQLTTSN